MEADETGRWISAIGKHVIKFQQDAYSAAVFATLRTSQEIDLLIRMHRNGRMTARKVHALAQDCGLPRQEIRVVLDAAQTAGLLEAQYDGSAKLTAVVESIFTETSIFAYAAARIEQRDPGDGERLLVPLMDLLSRLPLDEEDLIGRLTADGADEADVAEAIGLAETFQLLQRRIVTDAGATLLYNEYLWGQKIDQVERVLAGLRDRDTNDLLALMEEIRQSQGTATESLTAAPQHLVQMATRVGLVDAIDITTATGKSKQFTFSPQFHGLGVGPADSQLLGISDQVKLLIASMQYGMRYSEDFKLFSPLAFLNRLADHGTAGDATPIGRDYVLVEKFGILRTVPTSGTKHRFEVVKGDVVTAARDALAAGTLGAAGTGASGRSLVTQQHYASPEAVRMTLGQPTTPTRKLEDTHLAAIREAVQNGSW